MKAFLLFCFLMLIIQAHAQQADFDIDFKKADSIALAYKGVSLDNLSDLSDKLTNSLDTDVERFRAIYMWVCTNIKSDYGQYQKIIRKRKRFHNDSTKLIEWNSDYKKTFFNKLFKRKKTICTGYAYLVKKLSDYAGLNCKIIHGYGRTSMTDIENFDIPNHSWNAIQLNDKWYLCDPTWASGLQDPSTYVFQFQYNDGYFLTSPTLFAKNHFPLNKKWLLLEENTLSFQTFLEAPIIYGNGYKTLKTHDAPKNMHNTIKAHTKAVFKYQLTKPINKEQVQLLIDNGYTSKKASPLITKIDKQSLTLEYQFNKTGFYDVHLMIDDDYISTYTFEVKS